MRSDVVIILIFFFSCVMLGDKLIICVCFIVLNGVVSFGSIFWFFSCLISNVLFNVFVVSVVISRSFSSLKISN